MDELKFRNDKYVTLSARQKRLAKERGGSVKLYIHTVFCVTIMAHQQPPKPSLFTWRVPTPADPAEAQTYLDLGWIVNGGELMWSHAKGAPVHPGEHLDEGGWGDKWGRMPSVSLLSLLPLAILSEGQSRLPNAADCNEPYLEVPVMVLIKYQRMTNKKGKSRNSFWSADEAKLIGLAADPLGKEQ